MFSLSPCGGIDQAHTFLPTLGIILRIYTTLIRLDLGTAIVQSSQRKGHISLRAPCRLKIVCTLA